MAFSLDHSLTHLEIKEADLNEIYSSSNIVVPPEEQCQGHPCEAHVCSAREDGRFSVYVAFFDTTTQRPVILSAFCDVLKHADQKRLVSEALRLTRSMGFDMEPVKLAYSAAMRQVIIQGINVMRPPKRPVKRPLKTAASQPPPPGDAPPPGHAEALATPGPEITPPEVAALRAEAADLRRALTDMASAKAETEKRAEQTISAIKLELEKTVAAHREQAESFQEKSDNSWQDQAPEGEADAGLLAELANKDAELRVLEELLAGETARKQEAETKADELGHRLEQAEAESAALRLESDRLRQDEAAGRVHTEEQLAGETAQKLKAETKVDELGHRLEEAEAESAALRRELDRLRQDMAAGHSHAEEQLAGEVARRAADGAAATEREHLLRNELAAALQENSAVQCTLKNLLEEQQVLADERETLRAELALLGESAGVARQQERDALAQEQEGLQDCIRRLEHDRTEARQRYETLLAEKELELEAACAELKSLSTKQEYLLGEKKLWDTMAGNFKKKAHKAVERLKQEKQALEEKLKRLEEAAPRPASVYGQAGAKPPVAAERAMDSPFAALGLSYTGPGFGSLGQTGVEPPAAAERAVESPFAALGLSDAGSGFSGFGNIGPTTADGGSTIRYTPQVPVISYHSTDDIVELYGSANMVRATPEGRRSQDCSAYVCVVERGGKTAIHLAWHLTDTGEILICQPEKQPEGAGSYARVLQDAIFYFESVGFMMDRFELSRNSHRQLKALEKIGICRMDAPDTEQGQGEDSVDTGAMPAVA